MNINLKEHIDKLRSAPPSNQNLLFWGTAEDKQYLPQLKGCVGAYTTFIRLEKVETLTSVKMYCNQKGITKVISSSVSLLTKLLGWDKRRAPSLSNYAGSYFSYKGIEIVFIAPLKQLVTVSYGKFVATRLITKLTKPEDWYKPTAFHGFEELTASSEAEVFKYFKGADLISIDIETFRENATIRCLSYTGFFLPSQKGSPIESRSVVLALDSEYNLSIMRKFNWKLEAPKVFQNGKYDIAYLARYNAPVYNYLYDTAHLFHSWYSELPKDLGFLNAFFIREAVYWKDLAETNDLYEYYRYNALDTWGTGNCFLAMLLEAPKFAISNYLLEFPLVFPCHLCEMTGIARDMDTLETARSEQQAIVDKHTASLNAMLGVPEGETFNVKSSPQMKALFKTLGCVDLKSQDEKNLKKARFRHPFNARILGAVLNVRKARTLISNYLTAGKEFTRLDGSNPRFLYSLNPHGTDSSRLASKSHHFWQGDNIQKIPRGSIVKQTFKADPGFLMAEVDLEQAESRDTAYISGDSQLIENVENSPDFHKSNAAQFFGVPFEKVTKELRQLGKPVNHGANYNMGPHVLIETMGEENITLAKTLLKLPRFWGYKQVAEHLLAQFHRTYPGIKDTFYPGVIEEIARAGRLESTAWHHPWNWTGIQDDDLVCVHNSYPEERKLNPAWVRHCFGNPTNSKSILNSYISHPPQSLNAQTLNKGFLAVFYDIAMSTKYGKHFKLLAQIHDSILFQYREGHDYLCDMVEERMEIPVTIRAYDGKIRTFTVPASAKRGSHLPVPRTGKAVYWSETE